MFNRSLIYQKIKEKGYTPSFAVDGGYALGEWTHTIKNVFPEVKVLGIDANSQIFSDSGAEIKYGGLIWSEDNIELPFYRNDNPAGWCTGDSIFRENTQHYTEDKVKVEMIKSISLNTLCKSHNVDKIDILKLDVQGAELECLRGVSDYIDTIDFIELECATLEYNINAPGIFEIFDFLKDKFEVYDIPEVHYSYGKYDLIQVDFVFKNRNLNLPRII